METIPVEIRRDILSILSLADVKTMRLTSQSWASIGTDYLIPPIFRSLPQQPDIKRLEGLSQHNIFQTKIETIIFNHGEINEYQARHNTFFLNYVQDPEDRLASLSSTWTNYESVKARKEEHLPTSCEELVLTRILSGLTNLDTLSVTLKTFPFLAEEDHTGVLRDIWHIPSTRLLPRVATTERFTNILCAIAASQSSVGSLSHDRLPFEFFARNPVLISTFSTAFERLTSVQLVLDYSDMPNDTHFNEAFNNLALCLRSARSLRNLELAFEARRKIDITPLLRSFTADPVASLPALESLKLEGVSCLEVDLGDFLVRHDGSLKKLQLGGDGPRAPRQKACGGVHLLDGNFAALFDRLQENLNLTSCEVHGDLVELGTGKRWLTNSAVDADRLWEFED